LNDALSPGITQFLSNKDAANYSSYPKAFLNWVLFDNQFHFVQGGVSQVKSGTSKQALVADIPVMPRSGYLFIYLSNESSQDVFFDQLVVHHRPGPLLAEDHYYPFGLEMVGISDSAMNRLENRYRYNGMELNEKEFADGWGLDEYTARFRGLDVQIGRWRQIDPKQDVEESGYAANEDNPVMWSDPEGDCPWCLAILGEMAAGAAISGAIEAGIQLYDIATTDKKLSDFNWQQVGEAAAVGAVTGPIFSWAGRAVSPYLKRITAGFTSRAVGKGVQQVLKYAGYGGDVKAVAGRTMKALGKFEGGIDVLKVQAEKMGMLKQIDEMKAQMMEGVEMLNVSSHSWNTAEMEAVKAGKGAFEKYNVPFLEDAWKKGEIFRFVTDPVKYKEMLKQAGKWSAKEADTFGKELLWLEERSGKSISEMIDTKTGTIDLSKYNK